MIKKGRILIAGFTHNAREAIERHLKDHHVHVAGGLSDVRKKMEDSPYHIVIMNADRFGNNDIMFVNQKQNGDHTRTVAVHANKSKRRALNEKGLLFLPMQDVAKHIPLVVNNRLAAAT